MLRYRFHQSARLRPDALGDPQAQEPQRFRLLFGGQIPAAPVPRATETATLRVLPGTAGQHVCQAIARQGIGDDPDAAARPGAAAGAGLVMIEATGVPSAADSTIVSPRFEMWPS